MDAVAAILAAARVIGEHAGVKFTTEHHFPAFPAEVIAVLTDPAFHATLQLPDLALPEILEHVVHADDIRLRMRYQWEGDLDPVARKVLGGRKLTWLQEMRLTPSTGRGRLHFEAESDPSRLHGDADVQLEADADGTARRLTGELKVKVPVIGSMAERRILPGLVRRLDVEADAVRARLSVS